MKAATQIIRAVAIHSIKGDTPSFLEGSLQSRPGSLAEPSGEVFDVRVAPFPLKYSQFLY